MSLTQPVDSSILHEIVRIIESRRKVPEKVVVKSREYLLTYLEDHQRRMEEALMRYDSDRLNMLYGQLASKIKYQLLRRLPARVTDAAGMSAPAKKAARVAKAAPAKKAAKVKPKAKASSSKRAAARPKPTRKSSARKAVKKAAGTKRSAAAKRTAPKRGKTATKRRK